MILVEGILWSSPLIVLLRWCKSPLRLDKQKDMTMLLFNQIAFLYWNGVFVLTLSLIVWTGLLQCWAQDDTIWHGLKFAAKVLTLDWILWVVISSDFVIIWASPMVNITDLTPWFISYLNNWNLWLIENSHDKFPFSAVLVIGFLDSYCWAVTKPKHADPCCVKLLIGNCIFELPLT